MAKRKDKLVINPDVVAAAQTIGAGISGIRKGAGWFAKTIAPTRVERKQKEITKLQSEIDRKLLDQRLDDQLAKLRKAKNALVRAEEEKRDAEEEEDEEEYAYA
jgi:hypothetical protein